MYKFLPFLSILVLFSCSTSKNENNANEITRIDLTDSAAWLFSTGDSLAWADGNIDSSNWIAIDPARKWEPQGFAGYDGYAWYLTSFQLESGMKMEGLGDSIRILLGFIDDTEQTFLNGQLIGQNGDLIPAGEAASQTFEGDLDAYSYIRNYKLSIDDPRIKWGDVNILAVRVHDHGGGGGFYRSSAYHKFSGYPNIRMVDIADYLSIDNDREPFKMDGKGYFDKVVWFENLSGFRDFSGKFEINVKNQIIDNVIFDTTFTATIAQDESIRIPLRFKTGYKENHQISYSFYPENESGNISISEAVPYILTPAPPRTPRINGPQLYGASPNVPFLYRIPATGQRPIFFTANGLPDGLVLNENTGVITGEVTSKGKYAVTLIANNELGSDTAEFTIAAEGKLALTPPMGWNSWNVWGLSVSADKVKETADLMVSTGLADHGWQYINIDDGWEAANRTSDSVLLGNEKFPNFSDLADYVHSKGLKLGIYSSPGPLTCGGYLGSYQNERIDAQTWAAWGIDYLKYDWCAYEQIAEDHSLESLQKPYLIMKGELENVDRDIIYSLCQYGWGDVWEWGNQVGGHLWRTTGDILDTWESMSSIGFNQAKLASFAGPSGWNDPDMLVVGWVGWGPEVHPTRLSADEQYTHITLWALLSAPLLLGNDLTRMDDFTLNLLTNDEVLAINQDPAGEQAIKILDDQESQIEVWRKPLSDGTIAIGIFNLSGKRQDVSLTSETLNGEVYHYRDLWRQKDVGIRDTYVTTLNSHASMLLKLTKQ